MVVTQYGTDPEEFMKFNELLTKTIPNYTPFYVRLHKGDKKPMDSVNFERNRKTWQQCVTLLKLGFNIGLAAKPNDPLVLIDIDDRELVKEVPETLKDVSRSRLGNHYYFVTEDKKAKVNIGINNVGEVRSSNYYVVVPGSFVPCSPEEVEEIQDESERELAGRCTIANSAPVRKIAFEEFPDVFKAQKTVKEKIDVEIAAKKAKNQSKRNKISYKICRKSALWDLSISDVTGIFESKKRCSTPPELHGSTSGNNCSVQQGVLHCYRHQVYHNAFSFLCCAAGISTCEYAGSPVNRSGGGIAHFGVDATDGESVFKVWVYAKEKGFIPQDDPVPQSALIYYGTRKGTIFKSSMKDNSKIDEINYRLTLRAMEKEGIEHGRH